MKTIKYTVDRGFRKAGEVRQEEDGIADNLILRGFAEELDEAAEAETPEDEIGDGSAVDQYHPEGSEADPDSRGGAQSLPAELNAPGVSGSNASETGSNVKSAKGKAARPATETEPSAAALTSEVSVGDRTGAEATEEARASDITEGRETTQGAEQTEAENQGQGEQQS